LLLIKVYEKTQKKLKFVKEIQTAKKTSFFMTQ